MRQTGPALYRCPTHRRIPVRRIGLMHACLSIAFFLSHSPTQHPVASAVGVGESVQESGPKKLASKHLPNAIQVRSGVISGGLPEGPAAFAELRDLGVQTIISVDGAKPDLDLAKEFSMRYVHIPHGYDGIPSETIAAIAKTLNELPGPIYIHCHHGKHRSPAAAASACVAQGTLSQSEAIGILQLAGTNRAYRGLFETVKNVKPIDPLELSKLRFDFPASCDVPPLVDAMVALEITFAKLDKSATGGWQLLESTESLETPHQAVLLQEHFEELLRLDDVKNYPGPFRDLLKESQLAALRVQSMLNPSPPAILGALTPEHREALGVNWKSIRSACTECHQRFRDPPK